MMRYLLTAVVVLFGGITAQAQVAGQPYQVPQGYEQYGAGTLINYGGSNYVTSGDGTMLLAADQGGQSQGIIGQPVYQQYQPYLPGVSGRLLLPSFPLLLRRRRVASPPSLSRLVKHSWWKSGPDFRHRISRARMMHRHRISRISPRPV